MREKDVPELLPEAGGAGPGGTGVGRAGRARRPRTGTARPRRALNVPAPAHTAESRLELPRVIAIDGPSASGKGTLSRRLAAEFGCIYVDTGAMYRTLAWWALQSGVRCQKPMTPDDEAALVRLVRRWPAEIRLVDGHAWLVVNGYLPRTEIRSDEVENAVPIVAQLPKIRDWMVARQRDCARLGPLVMEGRDIGTEVFPLAPVKFFLEADEKVRQARLADRGNVHSVGATRDAMDATRRKGALYAALDAIRIDNTNQTPDETYAILQAYVRERFPKSRT